MTVAIIDHSIKSHNLVYDMVSDDNFKVVWYSGTGCGGQHRNKKLTSCRVIHIPTGIMECRQGRNREQNLNDAKRGILDKLAELKNEENNANISTNRKTQIGSGMRGDKTRTYRFQDDIVKDHNNNKQSTCTKIMKGNFHDLWY